MPLLDTAIKTYDPAQAAGVPATSTGYTATPTTSTGYAATPTTAKSYEATPYSSVGYAPTPYDVPKEGIVENRVNNLIATDSPLMRQAATRAKQYANSRGLLNSSLAAQAGQEAVISAATPIATSDAGAFNLAAANTANAKNAASQFGAAAENAALTNTAAAKNNAAQFNTGAENTALAATAAAHNAASQFTAGAANTALQNTAAAQNTASSFTAGAANAASQANAQLLTALNQSNAANLNTQMAQEAQAKNTQVLAQIDNETKIQLANLQNANSQLLQTNQSAGALLQDAMRSIATIAADPTLDQNAKDRATNTQIGLLKEGLRAAAQIAATVPGSISSLNLDGLFVQTGTGGGGGSPLVGGTPEQQAQQVTQQRTDLQRAITDAQALYTRIATEGFGVPVLSGPNASERRVPIWNQIAADQQQKVLAAQRALEDFNRNHPA